MLGGTPPPLDPTILVSCQQTRFHRLEAPDCDEIDIHGLSIAVTNSDASGDPNGRKGKAKARAEGVGILEGAELRLKAGVCYGLVGRNGTGKSSTWDRHAPSLVPIFSVSG
ncbi:hypothetical protein FGG08_004528 [Glutinoglossum americanum]|uniref:ABC transporter domain-containing protein n=1 Tax=Glutinoglossum americanum TaxID=1670608 RepID=A0A9P8L2N8_9PEZI|nr:hypothetical protein FGG08_004528 [Glutinoglossum americanum]